jgi:hypothetical protein
MFVSGGCAVTVTSLLKEASAACIAYGALLRPHGHPKWPEGPSYR